MAQPPTNDTRAGAVVVDSVPFTYEQDTSEARASGPRFCSNNGSVFFRFTPTETMRVQVDTIGSDYDTVLSVFRRNGGIDPVACNDDRFGLQSGVRFRARAGITYWIMVAFCCGSGESGRGGHLVLTVTEVQAVPLDVQISVDPAGTFDRRTGMATVSGTATCNERAAVFIEGTLRQLRRHFFLARGFFFTEGSCLGSGEVAWTATVDTDTGIAFGRGDATLTLFAFATDGFRDFVDLGEMNLTVRLGRR